MATNEQIVILADDLEAMIEEASKPALPVGKYLAVITKGEAKLSTNGKNSYGITWSFLINNNPESVTNGWDTEAGVTKVNYFYTYIGKMVNGRVPKTEGKSFAKMMGYLGINGKALDLSAQVGRQMVVIVDHKPSLDEQRLQEQDPTFVPSQLYVNIRTVLDYVIGDEHCPKLAYLFGEEGADEPVEEVDDAPAAKTEANAEEKADETPKKKRASKSKDDADKGDDPAW